MNGTARDATYLALVDEFSRREGVTIGAGKGFGAGALKVGGKIFAMLSRDGQFVAKLPKSRVAALVAQGLGEKFNPTRRRPMQEWFCTTSLDVDWRALAEEAYKHGGGQ